MIGRAWVTTTDQLERASHRGVMRVAELATLGIPPSTSYRRCLPGGPWRWLLPGIVLLSNGRPSADQRLEAAMLHAGKDAIVTGAEALRRHGLPGVKDDETVHLLVPKAKQVRTAGFALVERTIHMPRPVLRDGVPLAPLARATLDVARRSRDADRVRALLTQAVQRGRCGPAELLAELDFGSQRGTAVPRRILGEIKLGARSVAEAHGLAVWRRSKLPPAQWNVPVHDVKGDYVAMPDAWCDEVALAWEIDSYEFHFERDGYARTLARNTRYTSAGIVVVQTLPSRLRDDPLGVVRELRAAYTAAKARPRPPVTTRPTP